MKLKKAFLLLCFFCIHFSLFSVDFTKEDLFRQFGNDNNLTYIEYLEGKLTKQPFSQSIVVFNNKKHVYKILYFEIDNNSIIESIELFQLFHGFNTSVFEEKCIHSLTKKGKLFFLYDLTGDGYDEVILDYGFNKLYPLVMKFDGHSFNQILKIDGFPVSDVVLPGAPDVYETWKLKSFENGRIILKRYQSDLIQYITFVWNQEKLQCCIPDDYDYFSNTGFINTDTNDFKYLRNELSEDYLAKLSPKELRLLRNAIYAKYGREFNSWDLADNFLQCKWYKSNSSFSESQLNNLDLRNIELIQTEEKKKGVYKPYTWKLKFNK